MPEEALTSFTVGYLMDRASLRQGVLKKYIAVDFHVYFYTPWFTGQTCVVSDHVGLRSYYDTLCT